MTSQGGPDLARVLAVACLLGCASLGFGEGLRHDALPEAVSFPALRSGLGTPRGLAIGLRGNVFVASESLGLVFELNATGELAIAVETPEADSVLPSSASGLGDGPSARSVRLGAPMGLAVDASGHLYIADRTAQLVRRLDSATGVLTTVAGAGGGGSSQDGIPATSARLLAPVAVVLDTTGHLYFADAGNHCIRRVDAGTGFISTVAGDGVPGFRGDGGPATEAQLDSPYGLAFDKAGDLYVADRGNHRVRRIKLRTGAIATVAGRGVPGLAGDGGPALAAELNEPTGLGFDHRGRLLIVDSGNSRLRRVTASGRIETVKGTETGLLQPFAVARDRHGRLFVTDAGRRLLLRVEGRGRPTTMAGNGGAGFCGDGGPARNAKLSDVRGLAVGPNGDLYLADADHHRIRRIDGATGLITTVAGDGRPGFDGDGGPAGQASLRHPSGVALEGAGRLLIADSGNHRVRRVSADGLIATIAGSGVRGVDGEGTAALDAALDTPWSIAVDTLGDVLFSQARNGCVRSVDSRSGVLTTVAGNPFTRHPALDGEPARAGSLGTSVGGWPSTSGGTSSSPNRRAGVCVASTPRQVYSARWPVAGKSCPRKNPRARPKWPLAMS